jgi:DNA-binding IclR family transcriptional regulator
MTAPISAGHGGDKHGSSVITALRRGLDILDMFSADRPVVGIIEIAAELGIHKSSASRLAATLAGSGYLSATSAGNYVLGARIGALGSLVASRQDLTAVVTPFLADLVEVTGETGHLAVLDGTMAKTVQVVDGWHTVRMHSWVGKLSPAYCSSMGKALLAGLSTAGVEERYPDGTLPSLTEHTITTVPHLHEELGRIRRNGYCLDYEELEPGLRCVAAPVFSPAGTVDASISISGPAQRLSRSRMTVLARLVRWHAWRASVARLARSTHGRAADPGLGGAVRGAAAAVAGSACGRGSAFAGRALGGVQSGEVAEGHPDGEGGAGARVPVPGPEGCRVADCVQAGHDRPLTRKHTGGGIRDRASLGADHPGVHPHRVVGRPVDRPQARVALDRGVAVVDVVGGVAALEVVVDPLGAEAVPTLDRAGQFVRVDLDQPGQPRQVVRADDVTR